MNEQGSRSPNMPKRRRQFITCLDCKNACSADNLCRCCVAIQADTDEHDYLAELHAETERQRRNDIRDGRSYV
jgi:hypothetical protein